MRKSSLGRTNLKVKDILSVKNVEEKQIIKDMLKILKEENQLKQSIKIKLIIFVNMYRILKNSLSVQSVEKIDGMF